MAAGGSRRRASRRDPRRRRSAVVYPAAALATRYNERAFVAEIDPEETPISARVNWTARSTAAELLPRLVAALTR